MSPEFQAKPPIETIKNPFRVEKGHRIMVNQARQEMQKAGWSVRKLWSTFVTYGIQEAFHKAMQGPTVEFSAKDSSGVNAWYQADYKFSGFDKNAQPVDIFHIKKENPDNSDPPTSIEVSTYRGINSRYSQLVSMETHDPSEQVPGHFFYFVAGDLQKILQIAQPQVLFPSKESRRQFFSVSRKITDSQMEVEVGLVGDNNDQMHSYQYFRGLVMTNRLRVEDGFTGEMDLISVSQEGIVEEPASFILPEAVANIGNFSPAIANQTIG